MRFRALLDHFGGDVEAILHADADALRKVYGIGGVLAQSIRAVKPDVIQIEIVEWQKRGVHVLTWDDPAYPARLKALHDAPPTLFVVGDMPADARPHIAIVGTRQPAPESLEAARGIAYQLAAAGWVIVSGLALGIDAQAHIGALAVPNALTLAVLGGGVLNLYPPSNRSLAEAICKRGAILSENAPFANSKPAYLVARNRLVSGMSDAVIVIETSVTGGAMHAARRALDQGRTVYVIENGSSGNQTLLDEGAQPFSSLL